MNWIKAAFEAITQAVKMRDKLFVRIVPCSCGSLEPKLDRMMNSRWIVFCPVCRNRTVSNYRSRRRAKIVWMNQNKMKG